MKHLFTFFIATMVSFGLKAQYDTVSITMINTPVDLNNCNDTSMYYLDTVVTYAYVVTDGGLSEVSSSSISGANQTRPFIWMNDTANGGAVGPRTGLEVMGVNWGTSQATNGFVNLLEGELIEMVGVVGMYGGATQFQPLNDQSITILSGSYPSFTPRTVAVGDLNDANQVNQLTTGQEYEGAFVKINNVVVTSVNAYGSGTTARVDFTVADSAGNTMQIYDFFLGMKLTSWATLNPNSPATNGNFTAPTVGTFYNSIQGVIEHSANGCLGGTGSGYRMHPFKDTHFDKGLAAPAITNVMVSPTVPTDQDPIIINADVNDPDGSVVSVDVYWANDTSLPISSYTQAAMTMTGSNTYEYTIPAQTDGTIVTYYIEAIDNDTLSSIYPATPASATEPNTAFVYVLNNGLTIMNINQSFDGSGTSPFNEQEVTIKGFVTSGDQDCDLGYVYIQDSSATEHAAIALRGSLDLVTFIRGQELEVTGIVSDGPGFPAYDFASITVSSVSATGNEYVIEPIELDPSDPTVSANMEAYEGMLVKYVNPAGQLYITDGDIGFGEYRIATSAGQTDPDLSKRVLAGRDVAGQAESSLWVSLVSDTSYATTNGTMQVPAVAATTSMTMDAIVGNVYYAFSNYKLTPRNNDDFINLSVALDTSCSAATVALTEAVALEYDMYPNPAQNQVTLAGLQGKTTITFFNINGSKVMEVANKNSLVSINTANLNAGVYLIKVEGDNTFNYATKKLIITE